MSKNMSNIDRDEKIAKAKRRIDVLNKWRLAFLFIAILGLLFVFWGGKLWEGTQWFNNARYATACCLKLLIFTSFYVRNRRNCRPAVQGRGWYGNLRQPPRG